MYVVFDYRRYDLALVETLIAAVAAQLGESGRARSETIEAMRRS